MRSAVTMIVLVLLLAAAAGCGGDDSSKRSAYAEALNGLCAEQLAALEAIGSPDTPAALEKVLPRQLVVMRKLEAGAKALKAGAGETMEKKEFDRYYAVYVDAQAYGLTVLKQANYDSYFQVIESAIVRRGRAEQAAARIGATDCARHPFDDS